MTAKLLFLTSLAGCALRAATLTGTIQDPNKAPVDGAAVTVWEASSDKGLRTVSVQGRFTVTGIPEGNYLVKLETDTFATVYGSVQLVGEGPHELNLVLVDGSNMAVKAERPIRRAPEIGAAPLDRPQTVKSARLLKRIAPVYPEPARRARISGKVTISATLHTDGTLDDLIVLSAPRGDLAMAALLAVREWRYSPTLLDDLAVEVFLTIDVNFAL